MNGNAAGSVAPALQQSSDLLSARPRDLLAEVQPEDAWSAAEKC